MARALIVVSAPQDCRRWSSSISRRERFWWSRIPRNWMNRSLRENDPSTLTTGSIRVWGIKRTED